MSSIFDPAYYAFTFDSASGKMSSIICDILITKSDDKPDSFNVSSAVNAKALWDTGATGCVVTPSLVQKLSLKPISLRRVRCAGDTYSSNVYLVNIALPNKVIVPNIEVTECKETNGNFDFIVGMSVITLGDFALTNENGNSKFSYRMPAMKHIDYVSEHKEIIKARFKGIGRNDKCPCNSGQKFKDCHLDKL